jgi:hypothetical protein
MKHIIYIYCFHVDLLDEFIEIIKNPKERKKYRLETHTPVFRPDINKNSKISFI